MADIFISYKREDRPWAKALAGALETQGWSVWWDTRLAAGERFDDVIGAELKKARCVIVLWSKRSVESEWVKDEAHQGKKRRILVPVLIDNVEQPWAFQRIHAADLKGWKGKIGDPKFRLLVEDISLKLGPPPGVKPVDAGEKIYQDDRKSSDTAYFPWLIGIGILAVAALGYWLWPQPPESLPNAPTAQLSAPQTSIEPGDSTQLRWSTTHTENVRIEPGIGEVSPSGSRYVSPVETTTYTLMAEGNGEAIDTLVIRVREKQLQAEESTPQIEQPPPQAPPDPVATFAADRSTIQRGESTTLRWSTSNVASVRIEPGIGIIPLDGSREVDPNSTTTYTLTAAGEEASVREQVVVRVTEPPPAGPCPDGIAGMKFKLIKAGSFMMGSNDGNDDEKPVHSVRISKDFCMGVYEVTQQQWEAVMQANPSGFKGATRPVERVSWTEVQTFIDRVNRQSGCNGCYRLSTEAEWEYAARAGTSTKYSFGDNEAQLGDYAWYRGNSDSGTHPVGQKEPNPWGLYDMHGNVWEWVQDWYESYPEGTITDPTGPGTGSSRVLRGGGWNGAARVVRSASRGYWLPDDRYNRLGFRLVRAVL